MLLLFFLFHRQLQEVFLPELDDISSGCQRRLVVRYPVPIHVETAFGDLAACFAAALGQAEFGQNDGGQAVLATGALTFRSVIRNGTAGEHGVESLTGFRAGLFAMEAGHDFLGKIFLGRFGMQGAVFHIEWTRRL